jgi:diaminohydroxyphosphoribosylaminopyrimidine deaminase/5-amino-6-(5-phosphoribosylamino)uracil reductase
MHSAGEGFMRRALELAERGSGLVNPNPLVGAVVVRDEKIVAEGYHRAYGGPHAEVEALERAGSAAKGAELYLNLEPCIAYAGKQTPACAERIIASSIARVIIAMRDPNPHISSRGIEQLRAAGIEVVEGLLQDAAQQLNEIHTKYVTTGQPFVLLKLAMTADGKIASVTGDSRWISSEESRRLTHQLRNRYAAIAVGSETVLGDDPQLTVRLIQGRDPLRIVLDSRGRIPLDARILHLSSSAKTAIATTDAMPASIERQLSALGTEIWRLPKDANGHVDLSVLLQKLGERKIDSLLVEGGATLAWSLLSAKLVDKVLFFIAPLIIGGRQAASAVDGAGFSQICEGICLRDVSVMASGPDFAYQGYPEYDRNEIREEAARR